MADRSGRERAALGFSVHTGWAAAVAIVAGPDGAVTVVDHRKLEMIAGSSPDSPRFVFHAASKLAAGAAEALVRKSDDEARKATRTALRALVDGLGGERAIVGSVVLGGSGPPDGPLASILASHALIHAAEGKLFRDAIRAASESLGIPVTEIRTKELPARAAASLRMPAGQIARRLAAIGRAAGRPWGKDQKDACLAAWTALGR